MAKKRQFTTNPSQERRRMWSRPVLTRYWLLQLPGLAFIAVILYLLREMLALPTWVLWTIVGISVAKDVVLYPIAWRAYDPNPSGTAHSLEGASGVAVDQLNPAGYVRVQGELWRAELANSATTVDRGTAVRVHAVRGLTLLVEPQKK